MLIKAMFNEEKGENFLKTFTLVLFYFLFFSVTEFCDIVGDIYDVAFDVSVRSAH